jgi:hypothetical protein
MQLIYISRVTKPLTDEAGNVQCNIYPIVGRHLVSVDRPADEYLAISLRERVG